MTSTPTSINHPAHTLLLRHQTHKSNPDATTQLFTDKIQHKPLHLQPTTAPAQADNRALRTHIHRRQKQYYIQKQKPRPLSAKLKRELGVYDLKADEVRFGVYRGLNRLWNGYMLEILGILSPPSSSLTNGNENGGGGGSSSSSSTGKDVGGGRKVVTIVGHGSLIASADYHGAEVEVVRAKDVGRVGLKGIVVRETKGSFVLVTKRDKMVRVLKKGTVFQVEVVVPHSGGSDGSGKQSNENNKDSEAGQSGHEGQGSKDKKIVFELHGSQLEFSPVDRASRKFKWKSMDDL